MKQLILIAICLFVIKLTIQFTKDSHTKNDKIIEHGEQSELYAECGFDAKSIAQMAKSVIGVRQKA